MMETQNRNMAEVVRSVVNRLKTGVGSEPISPVSTDSPLFPTHAWWRSSGTTATCEKCNVVAYGENRRGWAISFPRREITKFGKDWLRAKKTCPPCEAK